MKKIILLFILFVLVSLSGYSRNALPFQGSKWTYIYSREFSHNFIYFYVQGDTVIDNISRSKLYVISDNAPNESHLLGFLHSTDKKVYLRTYENSWRGDGFYGLAIDPDTDYLMYDFSLEKGDEFTKPITLGYTEKMYIYDVDSIEIGNTKKKRYTIKDSPDSQSISDYWIEGMGSVEYGIILYGFEAIPTCFCSKSFICYSENGETLYLNPEFDECPEFKVSDNLLNSSKIWSVLDENERYYYLSKGEISTYYKVGGDTVVGNIRYKQILKSEDEDQANWELDCLMREDGNKVYSWEKSWNYDESRSYDYWHSESLLYDFGLKENEYMDYTNGSITIRSYVDAIKDTIINGIERKMFFISVSTDSWDDKIPGEIWIEGLGSSFGLKRSSCRFYTGCYSTYSLLCVTESGEEIFHSPDFEECYYHQIYPSKIEEKESFSFRVSRGYSNATFIIKADSHFQNLPVKVYDSRGECVLSSFIDSVEALIDLRGKRPGVYFLDIGNGLKVEKIVVTY